MTAAAEMTDELVECSVRICLEEVATAPYDTDSNVQLLAGVAKEWLASRGADARHRDHNCWERFLSAAKRRTT